ncbi:MAG: TetR/AcrR family transcriptional regulator [Myxococcota bacterium]
MPRPTFDRLAPDKRARFVDAALDEFARHRFAEASVSRIVARLGIAKGSVYQYFDDKVDLFRWLVAEHGRRRAELAGAMPAEGTVWERLAAAYRAGVAEWQGDPRWARIGLRSLEPTDEPRLEALRREHQAAVASFLEALLRQGQAEGQVRDDVDPAVAAHFVQGVLTTGLLSALFARLDTDLEGWVAAPRAITEREAAALRDLADQAVELLRRGLAP